MQSELQAGVHHGAGSAEPNLGRVTGALQLEQSLNRLGGSRRGHRRGALEHLGLDLLDLVSERCIRQAPIYRPLGDAGAARGTFDGGAASQQPQQGRLRFFPTDPRHGLPPAAGPAASHAWPCGR